MDAPEPAATARPRPAPRKRSLLRIPLLIAVILLVPAIAMQFTDGVDWGAEDFAAGAGLLAAGAIVYVLAARLVHKPLQHALVALLLVLAVGLVWAQLAVGIFD
jgi:hypothetical protein